MTFNSSFVYLVNSIGNRDPADMEDAIISYAREVIDRHDCGEVYMLSNDCMPGVYKVGRTTIGARERAKQIGCSTGVPSEYKVLANINTPFHKLVELKAHEKLNAYRVSDNREFFKCCPGIVLTAIESAIADVLHSHGFNKERSSIMKILDVVPDIYHAKQNIKELLNEMV